MSAAAPTLWHEVPAPPPDGAPRELPRWGAEVLAVVVALAGPLVRAQVSPANRWQIVAAAGVAASALLALLPTRLWPIRLVVLAGTTLAVERAEGPLLALWLGSTLLLADWTIRRRRPVPWVPTPAPAGAIPTTVLLLLAAHQARDVNDSFGPLRLVALAGVLAVVGAVTGDLLPRLLSRLGHHVGTALGHVLFLGVGLVVVALPWLAHRLVAVDPLHSSTPPGTSFARRRVVDVAASHPWSGDALRAGPGRWYRVRRAVALPLLVVVAAVAVVIWRDGAPDVDATSLAGDDGPTIPAAYEGAEWYPGYVDDINWIMSPGGGVWRPLRAKRVRDVRTRTVNVVDGVRVTWRPPACDCRRVTVWMYGGSTTFGLGQRDEHTIASELARRAWEEGIALDVVNRGMPGHTHWTEANQLAWDLTVEDEPDLVVFYDGVNEFWGANKVQDARDLVERIEPLSDDIWLGIEAEADEASPPDGAALRDHPDLPVRSPEETGRLAVRLYERSREMAQDVGAANELPIRYFWQPSRLSRPPHPEEPRVQGDAQEDDLRAMYETAEGLVPDGVGDLTEALDASDDPLFSDDVHHNEAASAMIADAMYAQLRSDLERLAAGEEVGP